MADESKEEIKTVQPVMSIQAKKQELLSQIRRANSYQSQTPSEAASYQAETTRSDARTPSSGSNRNVPYKVLDNMKRLYGISERIKMLKDQFDRNYGTLHAITLEQLNIYEEKPEMTVEHVIKTIEEINERPAKIVESAYENVYKRKNEWYGCDNKSLFYAPI